MAFLFVLLHDPVRAATSLARLPQLNVPPPRQSRKQATVENLYHVPDDGKAEIVNGELRLMSPTGDLPGSAAGEIFVSLHARARRVGRAYPDNTGGLL